MAYATTPARGASALCELAASEPVKVTIAKTKGIGPLIDMLSDSRTDATHEVTRKALVRLAAGSLPNISTITRLPAQM